jgi:16S rRNA (adenine(1408)-N(1))-methyltransferase
MGTGDGLFVYRSARSSPRKLFIGIDANSRQLEKISEKIYRKPAKGGLPNVLFVQSAAEDLPSELKGIASEVYVNFPWGSLLSAVVGGDRSALTNLRLICSSGALLKVTFGLDPERDRSEIERLGLRILSSDYTDSTFAEDYKKAGFEIIAQETLENPDWSELETTWAKRLKENRHRSIVRILARANKISDE